MELYYKGTVAKGSPAEVAEFARLMAQPYKQPENKTVVVPDTNQVLTILRDTRRSVVKRPGYVQNRIHRARNQFTRHGFNPNPEQDWIGKTRAAVRSELLPAITQALDNLPYALLPVVDKGRHHVDVALTAMGMGQPTAGQAVATYAPKEGPFGTAYLWLQNWHAKYVRMELQ